MLKAARGREQDTADRLAALILLRLRAVQVRLIIDGSALLFTSCGMRPEDPRA